MNNVINVLIVEDEPLTINSLRGVLRRISNSDRTKRFRTKSVRNCDAAKLEIHKAIKKAPIDLVLLDINIPASKDGQIVSGEDLGMELKRVFPNIKIVIFTSYYDNYRLNNIMQSCNPDGLLIKSEIDSKELMEAINKVLNDIPYYSKTALKQIRNIVSHGYVLDKKDRQLLFLLSKGTKTKHLPEFIGLSKSGVERRKRNLKEVLCLENEDDGILLKVAKERGYI